ncbi:hypothetical protein Nepgr_032472 [Nepenthes gracilis]|uniref:GIY-YIG domain-containing protein n=1 Tax=Nepenthes gracilis TaxID=150966 RepID=A0AAD3Y7X2_NEPGR|nr:hypothetical protein Nepgr_032472 [Nepenthes gracilis]
MVRQLSRRFRSIKQNKNPNPKLLPKLLHSELDPSYASSLSSGSNTESGSKPSKRSWCVYLIVSSNPPIKTYVGATTDFCRRLKQHNGELRGGAKASRAGRPWICACIVRGFINQNESCKFESKWKTVSRKLPRKRKLDDSAKQDGDGLLLLLQHRQAALERAKLSCNFDHLQIDWQLNPSR